MRFSKLVLTNFRSFGPEPVEIEFAEGQNVTVLIGANNAGKSNVMDALRFVLASGRRYQPDATDFHQLDVTEDMRIELHLREPLLRENILRKDDAVHGFFLRAWQSTRAPDKGHLKSQHYCLDHNGGTFRQPSAAGRRREPAAPGTETLRHDPPPASTVVRQLGRVHFLSPSLYKAFETSGYGVLAQLLDLYREEFQLEDNVYKLFPDRAPIPRSEAYEKVAGKLIDVLQTPLLAVLETSLSENLREVLGAGASGAEVSFKMPTAAELLADVLRLHIRDDQSSPVLPIERLGSGYQSLLRVAILRTYTDMVTSGQPAVFLIEEPEAYLNPHLRRFFQATIERLGKRNEVFVTTHDPAFVSLTDYRGITRVEKIQGRSAAHRCTASLNFSYERVARKLRRYGNAEVLLGQTAVLCEGESDAAFVRALLERMGADPDSRSVSVVDCGSRDNLPDYISLLDELKIELVVVTDGDASKCERDPKTRQKVARVAKAAGERAITFTEDIEAALGTTKQRDNTRHLVSLAEKLNMASLPPEIATLRDQIATLCPPRKPSGVAV